MKAPVTLRQTRLNKRSRKAPWVDRLHASTSILWRCIAAIRKYPKSGCFAALVALCTVGYGEAQSLPNNRYPLGIYARYAASCSPMKNQTLDQCINAAAAALLMNPVISGINAELDWNDLNPSMGVYDWSELVDIFTAVDAWNQANPAMPRKTVMLDVNPGFHSPQWVFNNLVSCDPMFNPATMTANPSKVPSTCGYATFLESESANPQPLPLPLPWNPFYKSAWATFLQALAQQYGSNPDLVSVTIAGPTSSSAEMIVPNEKNDPVHFYQWNPLFALTFPPSYQNSDQAFIEAWQDAVDLYSATFSGLTLVITTGSGLPNFPGSNYTVPSGYSPVCQGVPISASNPNGSLMDCAAEMSVVAYLANPLHGGSNLKSLQENGLAAGGITVDPLGGGDLDSYPIRWLAQLSVNGPVQLPGTNNSVSKVFGGFQSGGPVLNSPANIQSNGCNLAGSAVCPNLTAEQALYNFMASFFDGTKFGASYGPGFTGGVYGSGIVSGAAPLSYLQMYDVDVLYVNANACDIPGGSCTKVPVTNGAGATSSMSAQSILELAAQQILQMAPPPAIDSSGIEPGTIQPGEWVSIFGTEFSTTTAAWTGNFPTSLGGVSVTIDGKAAFLSYVGPGQINLQSPGDAATGSVPVVVTTPTGSVKSTVTLASLSPEFFLLDAEHVAGIILRSNGKGAYGGGTYDILGPTGSSLGYATVAAKAGDFVELFGTGFGPTTPAVTAGQAYSGAAPTNNPVLLKINSVSATPSFSGLSGPGLYQLNLMIPAGLGTGDVPLLAIVGNVTTASGAVISLQ